MDRAPQDGRRQGHDQRTRCKSIQNPRKCECRSMVGSAGTRQPAASRSQACRRACPAHDAGVHLGGQPRLGLVNSLSAVRGRGQRAVVKDVGVRPPNDGQAAADDARPRPPEDATTLPQRRCTSCVYVCRSPAPRARSAPPSAATSLSPSPLPPPARGRAAPRCSPGTSPPPGLAPGPRPGGPQRRQHRADEVTLHLLTHAWVARAVRLPAVLVVQRARLRDLLAVHPPRPLRHRRPRAPRRSCRACGPSSYSSLAPEPPPALACRRAWGR